MDSTPTGTARVATVHTPTPRPEPTPAGPGTPAATPRPPKHSVQDRVYETSIHRIHGGQHVKKGLRARGRLRRWRWDVVVYRAVEGEHPGVKDRRVHLHAYCGYTVTRIGAALEAARIYCRNRGR